MTYRTIDGMKNSLPVSVLGSSQFDMLAQLIVLQNRGQLDFDGIEDIGRRLFTRIDRAVELSEFGYETPEWGRQMKDAFIQLIRIEEYSGLTLDEDAADLLALLFSASAHSANRDLDPQTLSDSFFLFLASAAKEKGEAVGRINSATAIKALIPFWTELYPFCRYRKE